MANKKTPLDLGRRERQIVETVVKLGEASVADVQKNLADPPGYSSVRSMLGLLVEKKWLKFRHEGKRYLYRPAAGKEKYQKTAIARMMDTFFSGSPTDAMAAMLDSSASKMSDDDFERMLEMIKKARKERQ